MRLDQALALSLLLHGLLLLALPPTSETAHTQALRVTLKPLPATTALPQTALVLPEDEQAPTPEQARRQERPAEQRQDPRRDKPVASPRPEPAAPQPLTEQLARELLYPAAAIAQGLEGEALVLLVFDADGRVRSASIEQSSGHALLDQAALRAARRLHAAPSDAAETLLPVRFRLVD